MGEGLKKITRRIKRLFVAEPEPKAPPTLSASQVIKPEQAITDSAKARKQTTRRVRPAPANAAIRVDVLPWGVVHVQFIRPEMPKIVDVRDPVTRSLDRREIFDGMKTKTTYYDKHGELLGNDSSVWI
jgi:hypothetical protein